VIASVLGPGPNAKHRLSSFEPDAAWQNEIGQDIYRWSGRTITYLGDWHTHPRSTPSPSGQDRRTVAMIASDPRFRAPTPLYAIIGRARRRRRRRWCLALWEWRDGHLTPLNLELCDLQIPAYNR
jgi:integrative and conjugative element protein (TIGR02256 family)